MGYFPYCLVGVKIHPIVPEMSNSVPLYLSLAGDSPFRDEFETKSQVDFSDAVYNKIHKNKNVSWSVGAYLEDRSAGLDKYPQMREQKRYYHLGVDINFEKGTDIFAPLDGVIVRSEYEPGIGNYGGLVVLKCTENETSFYLLFGHLERHSLPTVGSEIKVGTALAKIGDFCENGGWYQHLHLQVLTEQAYAEGWVNKGYCALDEIPTISKYAPDPTVFLIV